MMHHSFTVAGEVNFKEPQVKVEQSEGVIKVPVCRSKNTNGLCHLSWYTKGLPGKPKSMYEGTSGTVVFNDQDAENGKEK